MTRILRRAMIVMTAALVAVPLAIASAPSPALAQDRHVPPALGHQERLAQRVEAFVEDVAAQLGVPAADVEAAVRAVAIDRVQAAVTAGRIDPERAAALTEAVQRRPLGQVLRHAVVDHRAVSRWRHAPCERVGR